MAVGTARERAVADLVVASLRGVVPNGGREWTPALLAQATGLTTGQVRAAITALRYAGKVKFTALELSPGMLVVPASPDLPEPPKSADPSEAASGPSGKQLGDELRAATAEQGVTLSAMMERAGFTKPSSLRQLELAATPRAETVQRVRDAIRGVAHVPDLTDRFFVPLELSPGTGNGALAERAMRRAEDADNELDALRQSAAPIVTRPQLCVVETPGSRMRGRELVIPGALWAQIVKLAERTGRRPAAVFDAVIEQGLMA